VLQSKELKLVQRLPILNAWEERAEDPFRGLRAGPASFSPFSFPLTQSSFLLLTTPLARLPGGKRSNRHTSE